MSRAAEKRGWRDAQLASARSWLAGKNGPAILIGDLNLTMYSPIYRAFVAETGVRNARAGFGPLGTWPAWMPGPLLPLDHCLVRGPVGVIACRTGPKIGSDHLPLLVDLHLPGAAEPANH